MTREEAVAKIRKLRNKAKSTNSPAEAASARKIANEMMTKWGLEESDLAADAKTLAFEELLDKLESYAAGKELPAAAREAIIMLRKEMSAAEKADVLTNVVWIVRTGALFSSNKEVKEIKNIVEETLHNHQVSV